MPNELWMSHRTTWKATSTLKVDFKRAADTGDLYDLFPDLLLDMQSNKIFWLARSWGKS